MKILLGIIFLVCCYRVSAQQVTTYQNGRLPGACFSDADIQMNILTPPILNKEAYLSREIVLIRARYDKWVDAVYNNKAISANDYQKLKSVGIAITDVNNSVGMTRHDSIFIDKGLIMAMSNYSFSEAMLQARLIDTGIYNKWHYYFIDAIVKNDPVAYCTGTTFWGENFVKVMTSDSTAGSVYQQTYNSWLAFILLHEASHILLHHIQKWQQKYPQYNNQNLPQWHEEQFKYSRDQEFEADNLFLQMYMKSGRFDPSTLLSVSADWFILREAFYLRNGYTLYQTHPSTKERFSNMAKNYAKYASLSDETLQSVLDLFNTYYPQESQRIINGKIPEVPKLKGQRPEGVDEHLERFSVRDTQLAILFERYSKSH